MERNIFGSNASHASTVLLVSATFFLVRIQKLILLIVNSGTLISISTSDALTDASLVYWKSANKLRIFEIGAQDYSNKCLCHFNLLPRYWGCGRISWEDTSIDHSPLFSSAAALVHFPGLNPMRPPLHSGA